MVVHILSEGRALCGLPGLPVDWPAGHLWIAINDLSAGPITCLECVAVARAGAKAELPEEIYTKATEGKYDAETSAVLEIVQAEAVLVIVKGGIEGDGFSMAIDLRKVTARKILDDVPRVLRSVADNIEAQERKKKEALQ